MKPRRWTTTAPLAALLGTALLVVVPSPAQASGCVSHAEFDNTTYGLTPAQISNRYDTFGYFLDDTATMFRRGYVTCWAPDTRRVVVVYSYDTNTSIDWYTHAIGAV